ncbi:hypothetical protein [Mycolicibacterium hippocampi]|uniref:hypothetical protein n=1 Tax=Mycolicibacterium hippocampi TaxID=659824 RepID=UPI0035174330
MSDESWVDLVAYDGDEVDHDQTDYDQADHDDPLQRWGYDYDDEDTGDDYEAPLRPDVFRDFGYDEDDDERDQAVRGHRNTEVCLLCGWPLPLNWEWTQCEFPDAATDLCSCNGCLRKPLRTRGHQPQYCGKDCADRMKFALRRAKRRAAGATSRTFDADADRIADYRLDMARRARQRKYEDAKYRFDWSHVWAFPHWRPRQASYFVMSTSEFTWRIYGPANTYITGAGRIEIIDVILSAFASLKAI